MCLLNQLNTREKNGNVPELARFSSNLRTFIFLATIRNKQASDERSDNALGFPFCLNAQIDRSNPTHIFVLMIFPLKKSFVIHQLILSKYNIFQVILFKVQVYNND